MIKYKLMFKNNRLLFQNCPKHPPYKSFEHFLKTYD